MATPVIYIAELQDEDSLFSLGEICERCGVPADIVVEMVEYGIVRPVTNPADNDAALLTLLTQWSSIGDRTSLGAISHDGADDDLFGGTGDDDFSWESADLLDDYPALSPPDFNVANMGQDERFGPV